MTQFYAETASGDTVLVEIEKIRNSVFIAVGDRKISMTVESAFNLADSILLALGVYSNLEKNDE